LIEAAKALMVAGLCGTFLAFLGDALSLFNNTMISAPCFGSPVATASATTTATFTGAPHARRRLMSITEKVGHDRRHAGGERGAPAASVQALKLVWDVLTSPDDRPALHGLPMA